MADIRIKDLATTATTSASDDYLALDGSTNGTRKILATNVANNVTDVVFGASGPSAKSSIAARAARQGLVFTGTSSGFATMGSSLGTSSGTIDIVLDIPSSNPSGSRGVFTVGPNTSSANFGNCFASELRTDGKLWITLTGTTSSDYRRAESSSSLVSLFGGKKIRLTVVRDSSASTLTTYINGIVIATVETTAGTAPAWSGSVTGTYFIDGGVSSSENYVGFHSLSGFYNRALSAAEVVSLYEAGVPAGADYNSASNTSVASSAWTNAGTAFTSFTSASGTAFTVTAGASQGFVQSAPATLSLSVGQQVRVTGSVSGLSGTPDIYLALSTGGLASAIQSISSNGTFSLVFTCTTATSVGCVRLSAAGAWGGTFTNLSVTRLGLLLAPDAAQSGGGLTWYDTSGNAANITLPATGVTWNVPTSGYLTSSSSLNLQAGGTNQNITLTPSGTGRVVAPKVTLLAVGSGPTLTGVAGGVLDFVASDGVTTNARFRLDSQRFLFGTTTDSGALLQVGTNTTTSAGGMVFGTDTFLYRLTAGQLSLDYGAANAQYLRFSQSGVVQASIGHQNGVAYFDTAVAGGSIQLRTGVTTTALTLDSSQNATFAGKVAVASGTAAAPTLTFSGDSDTGIYNPGGNQLSAACAGSQIWNTTTNGLSMAASKDIYLGNAYIAGAPTATGYVTIKDSAGVTYKVLVST